VIGPLASAEDISPGAHPAPGMHPRHYSPRTRLLLVKNGEVPNGNGIYLQHRHPPSRSGITIVQMPATAAEYAAALYRQLHQADAAGQDWIAVDPPPNTPEWEAVNDRLRRSAS
jgi:L-threonylcarbamoyladenylate synthase